MKSSRPRTRRFLLLTALSLLAGTAIYTIFDNRRFAVIEKEITLGRLPEAFDGFRILQISDLHGRYFGAGQANLIAAVNRLDYDMIALTGDMSATGADRSLESAQAVLDLIDGIEDRQYMFWVDGNHGPYAFESYQDAHTGALTRVGEALQSKGVRMLDVPQAIERGGQRIWITPEMSQMIFDAVYRSRASRAARAGGRARQADIEAFYQRSYTAYQDVKDNGEAKIMLTHTPKQVNLSADELEWVDDLDYDLILAGHYHGGQIRVPFIGALYIPSPTAGLKNSGFFPPQNVVKGISYYGDVPQYVSAGLGVNENFWFLSFRLFNTPEINLITLRSGK